MSFTCNSDLIMYFKKTIMLTFHSDKVVNSTNENENCDAIFPVYFFQKPFIQNSLLSVADKTQILNTLREYLHDS